jgi:molybdopterin synthase sulfur carrier subunit
MTLSLLYFARVREAIGTDGEEVDPPTDIVTVADLANWLAERGGGYAGALADRGRLRAAVDQRFVALDAPLGQAREVAFFPPVTGG